MRSAALPIAVIGAGPVGLAAAAELVLRGEEPIVFESGPAAGSAVREWSRVRVFSPWCFNVAPAARKLLQRTGWEEPEADHLPTGGELVDRYLEPLSRTPDLEGRIRFNVRVLAIARLGFDKVENGRAGARAVRARGRHTRWGAARPRPSGH
jgi:2-polyprenyl-6-methoxyphenol hydroxylase-like FAD-dependent oxidoreductase